MIAAALDRGRLGSGPSLRLGRYFEFFDGSWRNFRIVDGWGGRYL